MSDDRFSNSTSDIRTEACAWIAQLESGNLKPADLEAFREWLKRSPRHATEIRRLARLSFDLNKLTDMAEPLREAVQHYQEIRAQSRSFWQPAGRWGTALSTALIVILGLLLMNSLPDSTADQDPIYLATAVGEHLEHLLPDGSKVELNTNSRLQAQYTRETRLVRLLQGEVLFTVEKDPSRPFLVVAGNKTIEAIGTAFVVRHDAISFEISVTHGTVELEEQQASTGQLGTDPVDSLNTHPKKTDDHLAAGSIVLRAGQSFSQPSAHDNETLISPTIEFMSEDELRRKLAWQEGLLEFSDTPLETVVMEVSRYSTLKIEISDPALRDLKFGGMFRTGDTEPLFKALETAFNIKVVHLDPDTVKLIRPERS